MFTPLHFRGVTGVTKHHIFNIKRMKLSAITPCDNFRQIIASHFFANMSFRIFPVFSIPIRFRIRSVFILKINIVPLRFCYLQIIVEPLLLELLISLTSLMTSEVSVRTVLAGCFRPWHVITSDQREPLGSKSSHSSS